MNGSATQGSQRPAPVGESAITVVLRSALERTGLPVVVVDDAQVTYANAAAERSAGADRAALNGVPLADLSFATPHSVHVIGLPDLTQVDKPQAILLTSNEQYRQLATILSDNSVLLFDLDLRVVLAAGDDTPVDSVEAAHTVGRLLTSVITMKQMPLLESHYRGALTGRHADVEMISAVDGRFLKLRVCPVTAVDGTIVGGLALTEEVSAEIARQYKHPRAQLLSNIGSCRYDPATGWVFDRELLRLWGVDPAEAADHALRELIVADDRESTVLAWDYVAKHGGHCTTTFRMQHGKTGALLYLQSRFDAAVDDNGIMLSGTATHIDVTETVLAREHAEQAAIHAAGERTVLLRRVGDALANTDATALDVLENISEFASASLNCVAVLRILLPNQLGVERDIVTHPEERTRELMQRLLMRSFQAVTPGSAIHEQVVLGGKLISRAGREAVDVLLHQEFTDEAGWPLDHCIIAPVRYRGAVLGLFSIFRSDDEGRFVSGDEDFAQLLADRMGSRIADGRARETAALEQRELLEHLASTEKRERTMLAEAIHDDPMQLIVAAILRIDTLRLQAPDELGQRMDQVADMLETAVERLRKLIVAVTPPDFDSGLGVALRNLAEGIFSGTECTVKVVGPTHVHLSPATKAAAYRILREALINVRKHAKAHNVLITVDDSVRVTVGITDDGRGSATMDAGAGHIGLITMRRRATAERGRLHIASVPGEGTTVTLSLPASTGEGESETARVLRVFLVDDHDFVRRQVAELLNGESDLTVVGDASSVAEALTLIPALRPDVAVLDVRLPDGNGVDLCRRLKEQMPELNCLMLTSYTDEQAMLAAILAGAGGFVIKDIKGMDLVAAVRAVGAGRSLLDNRAAAALMEQLRIRGSRSESPAALSEEEHRILELIEEGVNNKQTGQRRMQPSQVVTAEVDRLIAKLGGRPSGLEGDVDR